MTRTWTIEQLTGFLRRANINPDGYGERISETREEHVARILRDSEQAEITRIIEEDKRDNWPAIQAEMDRRSK